MKMKQIPFSTFTVNATSSAEICSRVSEFIQQHKTQTLKLICWRAKQPHDLETTHAIRPSTGESKWFGFSFENRIDVNSGEHAFAIITPNNPEFWETRFLPLLNDELYNLSLEWWNNNVEFLIED